MIIGLAGAAGCGKTTLAEAMARRGFSILSFADPIYEAVSSILGLSPADLRQRETKEAVVPWLGRSPRHLLQTLGTEWGRDSVSQTIWVDILLHRASRHDRVVVPDVRFDNEAEAIRASGGFVFLLRRGDYQPLDGQAAQHKSEAGISGDFVDAIIDNDGPKWRMIRQAWSALAALDRLVR